MTPPQMDDPNTAPMLHNNKVGIGAAWAGSSFGESYELLVAIKLSRTKVGFADAASATQRKLA